MEPFSSYSAGALAAAGGGSQSCRNRAGHPPHATTSGAGTTGKQRIGLLVQRGLDGSVDVPAGTGEVHCKRPPGRARTLPGRSGYPARAARRFQVAVSPLIPAGRTTTSAPYARATVAIASSSVRDHHALHQPGGQRLFHRMRQQRLAGQQGDILPARLLEPPRAGIMAKISIGC